jgi:hypothetical protein
VQEDQIKIPERIKGFSPVVFSEFQTTSPTDAHTAHLDFVELRAALCGYYVHSFSSEKERTKKADQGV